MHDTKKKYVVLFLPSIDYRNTFKFKCKYNVKRKVHPSEVVNKFKCKYKNYTGTLGWVSTLWGCGAMWFWL